MLNEFLRAENMGLDILDKNVLNYLSSYHDITIYGVTIYGGHIGFLADRLVVAI